MSEQNPHTSSGERETARIEAFSDGVFAIAITLLVLELHVPQPSELNGISLWAALGREWHSYLAFVMSFVSILIMWFNHHMLFGFIRRVDTWMPYLNGLLLLTVTVIPWPTSLLARYWGESEEKTAAIVFSGWMVVLAIAFNALWRYSTHKGRLLHTDVDMEKVNKITRQYSFGPIMYLVAFGLAFYHATASVVLCIAMAVFFTCAESFDSKRFLRHRPHHN
jgi:uncharacterized membrane protein